MPGVSAMCGFLNCWKPTGMTSRAVTDRVQKIVRLKSLSVGHIGTIDPMASGVLPLAVGAASKLIPYLRRNDKRYIATIKLGVRTDSGDVTGKSDWVRGIHGTEAASVLQNLPQVLAEHFTGPQLQKPPLMSAVKIRGRRMYDIIRDSTTVPPLVEPRPRRVVVHSISCSGGGDDTPAHCSEACPFPEVSVVIHCSSGTYVRALAVDLGARLGALAVKAELPATLAALVRTSCGDFTCGDRQLRAAGRLLSPRERRVVAGGAATPAGSAAEPKPQHLLSCCHDALTLPQQPEALQALLLPPDELFAHFPAALLLPPPDCVAAETLPLRHPLYPARRQLHANADEAVPVGPSIARRDPSASALLSASRKEVAANDAAAHDALAALARAQDAASCAASRDRFDRLLCTLLRPDAAEEEEEDGDDGEKSGTRKVNNAALAALGRRWSSSELLRLLLRLSRRENAAQARAAVREWTFSARWHVPALLLPQPPLAGVAAEEEEDDWAALHTSRDRLPRAAAAAEASGSSDSDGAEAEAVRGHMPLVRLYMLLDAAPAAAGHVAAAMPPVSQYVSRAVAALMRDAGAADAADSGIVFLGLARQVEQSPRQRQLRQPAEGDRDGADPAFPPLDWWSSLTWLTREVSVVSTSSIP